MIDLRSVRSFVLAILFVRFSYSQTPAERYAGKECALYYTYDYLWGNDLRTQPGNATDKTQKIPDPGVGWLTKMTIPAPLWSLNSTESTAYSREKEGWRILARDIDWWREEFDGNWTLLKEGEYQDVENSTENALQFALDLVGVDLDVYSEAAFPCNSTLSNFLEGKSPNMSLYGAAFMQNFSKIRVEMGSPDNTSDRILTQRLRQELEIASQEAWRKANVSLWKMTTSQMGVGWNVRCWEGIDGALEAATEWDKAASSAATTLMALIPVLLTFGNLILPRDSEAFCSSFLVGIMSAAFSLGLPGKSITAITRKMHRIDVGSFEQYGQDNISKLGRRDPRSNRAQPRAFYRLPFSDLWSWVSAPPKDDENPSRSFVEGLNCSPVAAEQRACSNAFWNIREEAEQWSSRPHYWHILSLAIFCLQIVIFVVGILPLFLNRGTPLFMFSCGNYLSSLWMLVTAAINAAFRFAMWEFSSHERVRVYSLSQKAKESLDEITGKPKQDQTEGSEGILDSTETELPPRYHPLITRMILATSRSLCSSSRTPQWRYRQVRNHSSGDSGENTDRATLARWLRDQIDFFWRLWVKWPCKNPLQFIRIGFSCNDSFGANNIPNHVPNCARRWRPLTVLLHLSSTGRKPFTKLLTGLVEGTILLLLTVFFASQWGGNIYVVSYTIALLLVFVTIGRLFSLWYIYKSAYFLGLHVIECQSNIQISGCLRILCSMPEVLVVVNGAYYYGGFRLDQKSNWASWRRQYDSGEFDDDRSMGSAQNASKSTGDGEGSRFEALRIPRKPLRPPFGRSRRHHEERQSAVALQDLSGTSLEHSRPSSDQDRDSGISRAPDTCTGHENL